MRCGKISVVLAAVLGLGFLGNEVRALDEGDATGVEVGEFAPAPLKVVQIEDGAWKDLGQLNANGQLMIVNAGTSKMIVNIWDASTGVWTNHEIQPGRTFRRQLPQNSLVQLGDVPDHVPSRGGYTFPGA